MVVRESTPTDPTHGVNDDVFAGRGAGSRYAPGVWTTIVACVVVAVLSMEALPGTLSFDPWAWIVWGEEVVDGTLDTTGGPSWKPFPVLITAPLSLFGDAAPVVWMVVARTGGLLTMVITARLAIRLASRLDSGRSRIVIAAGTLAGAAMVFTPDGGPRWLRVVAEGHADPLAAGFVVLAIDWHLATESGRSRLRRALLALGAASLIRPEAWPFLLLYGLWLLSVPGSSQSARRSSPFVAGIIGGLGRIFGQPAGTPAAADVTAGERAVDSEPLAVEGSHTERVHWAMVVAVWVAVPVLWFGGDLWGSGDFWHGADAAQVGPSSLGSRLWLLVRVIAGLVPVPVWILAAVAVVVAGRRRDQIMSGVAAIAVAWAGVVSGLTLFLGYAALRRFFFPTVALTCVLAAVGLVQVMQWVTAASRNDPPPPTAGVLSPRARTVPGHEHSGRMESRQQNVRRPEGIGKPTGRVELRWRNVRRLEASGRLALVIIAGVVSLAFMAPRIISIGERVDEVFDRREEADDLERAVDATLSTVGGHEALLACGPVWIEGASLLRPMLPWLLDLRLHDAKPAGGEVKAGVMFAPLGGPLVESLDALAPERRQVLASSEHWTVVAVDCRNPPTE